MRIADEKDAYTIADRGTYLATRNAGHLAVLVDGGRALLNVYHVIDITRKAGQRVNAAGGRAFADWIVSPDAQRMIGEFGAKKYGRPLFTPDAGKTDEAIRAGA